MGADDQQLELLGALEALGGSAGNGKLRDLLGWDEVTYEAVKAPLVVASGAADTITPPAGCEAVARGAHAPYVSLGPVGHVCALEGHDAVNALLK